MNNGLTHTVRAVLERAANNDGGKIDMAAYADVSGSRGRRGRAGMAEAEPPRQGLHDHRGGSRHHWVIATARPSPIAARAAPLVRGRGSWR